ncbi:MAG: hypothetical protein M1813_004734 [Trichoglossum hirsutum]|nr:MAG: hypothetical protein M1813_004734 [Trichoglossum hirsutum]
MTFDPFSPCVASVQIAGFFHRFWIIEEEIQAFRAELEGISNLIARVVSTRNRLQTLSSPVIEYADREVLRTRSALADLKRTIDLSNGARSGFEDVVTKIKWTLKYKTAEAHMKVKVPMAGRGVFTGDECKDVCGRSEEV